MSVYRDNTAMKIDPLRVSLNGYFAARKRLKAVCNRFEVSESDINILQAIEDLGSASPSRCAEITGILYQNILKPIYNLVAVGYIVLSKQQVYANTPNFYSITKAGREVLQYYSDLQEEELIKARQNKHLKK